MTARPAFAGWQTFMSNQGLSAGNAYAAVPAHSGLLAVSGNANHTHCPAVGTGWTGYTSQPWGGGNYMYWSSSCGPGTVGWTFSAGGSYYHGAEYNPNSSTNDQFSWAEWSW